MEEEAGEEERPWCKRDVRCACRVVESTGAPGGYLALAPSFAAPGLLIGGIGELACECEPECECEKMFSVRRELVVRPEHRLGAHDGVPDDAVDVQEETRETPREVAQEARGHRPNEALRAVGQVLVVVFLQTPHASSVR